MTSKKIWEIFSNFFIERDHKLYPSQSLIPKNDKSLLFVNAGVVPLKKYLLGDEKCEMGDKLVAIQPCLRVNDLENVGVTSSHHSLFEMVGFFSIGNYYKKEGVTHALNLLKALKIKEDQVYLTIYRKDKEIEGILKNIGFDSKRIIKMDSNFWDIGSGPCGPSFEIFFDKGEKYGKNNTPKDIENDKDNDRFIEIMNVVFSELNHEGDKYLKLKSKNIDCGGGFERIVAALQDKRSTFETDLFSGAINYITKVAITASETEKRVVADHIRASMFMIHNGVLPGAKDRQFILRKLIRRAVLFLLMMKVESLPTVIEEIVHKLMKPISSRYLDLSNSLENVITIIVSEALLAKKGFDEQLVTLKSYLDDLTKSPKGDKLFYLHESKGVDFELMKNYFNSHKLQFPEQAYFESEKKHKKASFNENIKKGFEKSLHSSKVKESKFIGYDKTTSEEKVRDVIDDNDYQWLVFDKTPFYPEGGGQVSDKGCIQNIYFDGDIHQVLDVQKNNGIIFHKVKKNNKSKKANSTSLEKSRNIILSVDKESRTKIEQNHSATHLLHLGLRSILKGDTIQSGSSKNEERLRLDFTSSVKFDRLKLREDLEKFVNQMILERIKVETEIMTDIKEAEEKNYLLTFLEDYGKHEKLRGVIIGDSKELCVGTHVKNTKDIELFKIKNLKTKGKNTFRIEALTGDKAKLFSVDTQKKAKKQQEDTKNLDSKSAIKRVETFQRNNITFGRLNLKGNFNRKEIFDLFSEVKTKLDIFVVIFGDNMNQIVLFSTEKHEVTFQELIHDLKNSNQFAGGGSKVRVMGNLKVTPQAFDEFLKAR